jgi:hypothetical protein
VHERINRTLTTIALLLSILLMGLLLYAGAEAYYKYLQVQEALSGIGAAPVVEQPLEDEIREPEVRDTGQDLSPFIGSTLGVPIDDGTVCAEDGNINAIVCEGPNADNGELFWNGVVIED